MMESKRRKLGPTTEVASRTKRLRERELKAKISQVREQVTDSEGTLDIVNAKRWLEELDTLFKDIDSVSLAKDDAEAFRELMELLGRYIHQNANESRKLSIEEFLDRLKRRHGSDGTIHWEQVGREYNMFFNGIPENSFMFGSLDVEPKVRKQRQQRSKKRTITEHAKPELVSEAETKDASGKEKKGHHEEMQALIYNKIKGTRSMLNLVVNPTSFTQTVENMFEFSFLVKECKIEQDKFHLPVVSRQNQDDNAAARRAKEKSGDEKVEAQSILSFDFEDYEKIRDLFGESQPVIPHRNDPVYKNTF